MTEPKFPPNVNSKLVRLKRHLAYPSEWMSPDLAHQDKGLVQSDLGVIPGQSPMILPVCVSRNTKSHKYEWNTRNTRNTTASRLGHPLPERIPRGTNASRFEKSRPPMFPTSIRGWSGFNLAQRVSYSVWVTHPTPVPDQKGPSTLPPEKRDPSIEQDSLPHSGYVARQRRWAMDSTRLDWLD